MGFVENTPQKPSQELRIGVYSTCLCGNRSIFSTNSKKSACLNVTLIIFTGLQTSENSKFYAISSRFKPFSNKGKTLVIQYTVKHEQKIDCGGGYIKIFSSDLDQKNLSGDSRYYIMFGEFTALHYENIATAVVQLLKEGCWNGRKNNGGLHKK